jgi:hypothetical protein
LTLVTSLAACEVKENTKQPKKEELASRPTTPIGDKKLMRKLIDSALLMGNVRAYNTVSAYYFVENKEQDFFYCAFTMANKHKSAEAHYHVFMIFAMSSSYGIQKNIMILDDKTKNLAMYYLLKSHEMGYDEAKYQIEEIFGKNKTVPKSSEYLQKLCTE